VIKTASAKKADRLEKILDGAQNVILRKGLRGTTMEEVAREAGVAKPTLYKYFPDKAALYDTLMKRFLGEIRAVFDAELAGSGSTQARIAAALAAKKKMVFKLLHASPHAHELYDDDPDISMDEALAFDRYVEDEITRLLEADGHDAPRYLAQLIVACSGGIAKRAQFVEQLGPAIRFMVQKLAS
jgi:AcrR family transcriptional regulator